MRIIFDVAGGAALLVALGIVGTVENGGDNSLMWWTLPLIALAAILIYGIPKKIFKQRYKSKG